MAAAHSNPAEVRIAADDKYRADIRIHDEPSAKRFNLRDSAESSGGHVFHSHFLALKERKIVALGRRHTLRQLQEIQRNWQRHLRETADFEAPYAEHDSWCASFKKEFQGVFLAMHPTRKNENNVGAAWCICWREPGVQAMQEPPRPAANFHGAITISHSGRKPVHGARRDGTQPFLEPLSERTA